MEGEEEYFVCRAMNTGLVVKVQRKNCIFNQRKKSYYTGDNTRIK
jgi:hypothetical protein